MRGRRALALAAAALLALPVGAAAAPEDCADESDVDLALCLAVEAGNAAQEAQRPLVPARDAATQGTDAALEQAGLCDPLDRAACLLPFPNDRFTVPDPTTATGRRLALHPLAMPRNAAGKPIDPTEWNRNDGWSPGTPVLTSVDGIDLRRTGAASIDAPSTSLRTDAPIVLLDAATGRRHPYWAELDANPTDGQQPLLIVRPAVNLAEGHRYVVAMRRLRSSSGAVIPAGDAFAARRDTAVRAGRSAQLADPVLGPLVRAGVPIGDLYLAWTFTVSSTRSLTERVLHMRDDAFGSLQGGAPQFSVRGVADGYSERIARRVTGTFTVPNYLTTPVNAEEPVLGTDPALPGTRLLYLPGDELPDRNGDFTATFTCDIPRGVTPQRPAYGAVYGHGLLGGQGEVGASNVQKMAVENGIAHCATDWYGMATGDVPTVASMLADMSFFPQLPDRVQQGMLAQLFLARLVKDPRGFASDPAFQSGGRSLLRRGHVHYDGNSQGGIIGGALMAVSQDLTRGVLGVPGMNYSTLLDRSVDFATYEAVFNAAYPNERDRQLVFGLIQALWDRGEANGYAAHVLHAPLPRTPRHDVLLHVAYGDHQVANVSAEVMGRTIGTATNVGFLRPGRHWGTEQGWGLPRVRRTPAAGSFFVYWDSGSDVPPDANLPPTAETRHGDPHEDPRATYSARVQKAEFLLRGRFVDTCRGRPCLARPLAPEDPPRRAGG